jgi:hypothetical protein
MQQQQQSAVNACGQQQQDFYSFGLGVQDITFVQDREGVVRMHSIILGQELQQAPHSTSHPMPGSSASNYLANSSSSSSSSNSRLSSTSTSALPVVGIDCEWQPYKKGMPKSPVALLQVATRQQVFVVDLLALCRQQGQQAHSHSLSATSGTSSKTNGGAGVMTTGSSSGSSQDDYCDGLPSLTAGEAALSGFLRQLLGHSDIRVVGFGLQGDLQGLAKSYPWLLHSSCAADSSTVTTNSSSSRGCIQTHAPTCGSSASSANFRSEVEQTLWVSADASRAAPGSACQEDCQQQWVVQKAVELQQLSKLAGTDSWQGSLSALVERTLGKPLDKSQQASNWAARPLSEAQMLYAANDAHVLTVLFDCLSEQLATQS